MFNDASGPVWKMTGDFGATGPTPGGSVTLLAQAVRKPGAPQSILRLHGRWPECSQHVLNASIAEWDDGTREASVGRVGENPSNQAGPSCRVQTSVRGPQQQHFIIATHLHDAAPSMATASWMENR